MKAPKPEEPKTPRMPDPEDPSVLEAQRKAAEAVYSRTGRRSTILH